MAKRTDQKNDHTFETHGFVIRSYEPPPPNFNPLAASERELLRYGFPTRPDAQQSPELRKRWETEFSQPRKWVKAEFEEVPGKRHGPARGLHPAPAAAAPGGGGAIANATSDNWSGSVAFAPAGRTFNWIQGQWTVPNPHTASSGKFFASEWVGIDGAGSPDVLQAGTETEVDSGGSIDVYAWWEWFPAPEMKITSIPVAAGDVVLCLICVNSTTDATVYYTNQSSLLTTSFTINPPAGTTLVGNSAEWVVERPTVGGKLSSLADYKAVYFDEGIAGLTGSPFMTVELGTGTEVTMTGTGGATLSLPFIETNRLMKMSWVKAS
jgi:hypothetical protein